MSWLLSSVMVVLAVVSGALAQELRLQDIPSTGLGPDRFEDLPLEFADRQAVEQAFKSRHYERAENLLVEQINKNPRSALMLTTLAGILFLDGKYLQCAVALKKAEALSPLDNRNRFTLALAYIILNHRDWARPELEKLVSADPLNPLYPYWLGRIDYDAMRFKEAVACFRKALGLDPHFMKGYDNLGLSYEALAQYDDAIREYEEGIRLNRERPDPSPWPDLNLATLLIKLGKLEEARKALNESLGYDHNFPKAHYQMGLLLEKEKRDKEAIEELNLAVRCDPSYPEPHYVLGRIYQRLGDKSKANAAWNTFQKLKKENPDVRPH